MENEVFIFQKFLEEGLVPEDCLQQNSRKSFFEKMNSLSFEDQNRSKRKFRKLFRKALRLEIRKILDSDSSIRVKSKRIKDLKNSCGVGEKPLVRHMNRRRFLVRHLLVEELKKEIK